MTGSPAKGGNWDLKFTVGQIQASSIPFELETIASYGGVLAIRTVANNADSGVGSLRQAIADAAAGDTILFASSLANQTITLTSGQLTINKNLIVDGANASNLTISGNNASRVFELQRDASFLPTNVTFRNLIIANGKTTGTGEAAAGAGILGAARSTLTVENCQLNNNVSSYGGAGIFGAFDSTTTAINSKFDGNDGTGGNEERGGGAIAVKSDSTLSVKNSVFTNNKGINGGAINAVHAKVAVENSTFINNDATATNSNTNIFGNGGAILVDGATDTNDPTSGTFLIRNSRFEGNRALFGGGVEFSSSFADDRVIVENSSFINNSAIKTPAGFGRGGGLRIDNGDITITNTTFANNLAEDQGGGLWDDGRNPTIITNSTFSGNKADFGTGNGLGGAIFFANAVASTTNITNTTIANNYASDKGGAIFSGDRQAITLKNTIFADNAAGIPGDIGQHTNRELIDGGNNIQWPVKVNNPQDVNVTANVAIADPLLGPLQDNGGGILTHALLPGSPAINAGGTVAGLTTDQRGVSRSDGLVDIGSFELATTVPPSIFTPNADLVTLTGGNDSGDALAGDDTVFLLEGNDTLYGNAGNDTIFGGDGLDIINGSQGNDVINGNTGDDILRGGQDNDLLRGGQDNDQLFGDLGNDTLFGDVGNDEIFGGDNIDIINGNTGDDVINGNEGDDILRGGQDNDLLRGGQGNDQLLGDLGNDTLLGDLGNDTLIGGDGSDRFVLFPTFGSDTILDFQDGLDLLALDGGLTFNALSITQGSNATLISVASSGELLASLTGIPANLIGINDFMTI